MSIYIIFIKLIRDPTSAQKPLPSRERSHNNMPLNLLYDTYYIKTYFIALKQVKLGCWFEMGCYDTDLSMLRIPQLDFPQKPSIRRSARLEIRTRSSRVGQRQQNFENRADINSKKILKQVLSLPNNILTL